MGRVLFTVLLWLMMSGILSGQNAGFEASSPGEEVLSQPAPVISQPCEAPCGPWDLRVAGHLMRRAGFSASPHELDQWVQKGFRATLDELLNDQEVDDREMEVGLAEKDYQLVRVNQNNRPRANAFGMRLWWL